MRAFFAVDLSGEIRQNISEFVKKCRAIQPGGISYTEPGNLHVTLKFLGDADGKTLNGIAEEAAGLCLDRPCFSAEGAGAFPDPLLPRVLWAGIRDHGSLAPVFTGLEAVSEKYGVPADGRPYHPHVTIGRVKRGAPVRRELADILKNCTDRFGESAAPAFVLYRSDLTSGGPVYTKIRSFPFKGGNL